MSALPSTTLSNGMHAEMRFSGDGGYQLVVDGTPQSHVDPERPELLVYEYVQRIGHVLDAMRPGPLTAVHLGAGALTLPRYVARTRPGSRQQVIELEPGIVEIVREVAPLPREASIRIRYGDARAVLERLPGGLVGACDLVVVDVFAGSQTPAHVTSVEFHERVRALLAPDGVLCVNLADGRELRFVRSQLATLTHVHPHVAAIADTGFLKGRRYGNLVAVASAEPLRLDGVPAALQRDPWPAKVVEGDELRRFASSGAIVTDATALPSPPPSRSVFG